MQVQLNLSVIEYDLIAILDLLTLRPELIPGHDLEEYAARRSINKNNLVACSL
jgi:hypothetical protein